MQRKQHDAEEKTPQEIFKQNHALDFFKEKVLWVGIS